MKNSPFVRILIPFLAGILVFTVGDLKVNVFYLLVTSVILMGILLFLSKKRVSLNNKRLFILASDVFLFLTGFYACYIYDIRNNPSFYGHYVNEKEQLWIGEIKDLSIEKEKFHKVVMEVKGLGEAKQLHGNVIVYVRKPFDVTVLKPGNTLKVKSRFNSPKIALNPQEFDYKTFLARKNIYYQSFVEAENVSLITKATDFSLVNIGLTIKQKIKSCFESGQLNEEAAQLCTALLTGYDDEINAETINAFAHSGTLHVLSVSGLHTGILFSVLIFLLGLVDEHQKYKWLHLIIISLVLWFFVLITGFSPPVLRAAIMLNLIAIGRFYYSYSSLHAFNILAASAFLILIVNPVLVYDAGFLLSYSAVAGILFFEPLFTSIIDSKYILVNKVWQLTSVSVSAQIATLPIALYFFHQFPIWFVFSNLLVIPLCTILMFLGLAFIFKLGFLAVLINACASIIFYFIHLTDAPGIGYFDCIDFSWKDLVFLSLIILVVAAFIKQRAYILISGAAALLVIWQVVSILEVVEKKSESHVSVYHLSKESGIDVKNKTNVFFSSDLNGKSYNYHIKNNHTFYNYPLINSFKFDYVKSKQGAVFKLAHSEQSVLIRFLKPEYIIVTNNVELSGDCLDNRVKLIVADGSNNYSNIKKLRLLCDKLAVPFYATPEKGYLELNL